MVCFGFGRLSSVRVLIGCAESRIRRLEKSDRTMINSQR